MAEFVSQKSMDKLERLGSSGDYLKYARKWTIDPPPDETPLIKSLGSMIESAAGIMTGVANYQQTSLDREISDRINAERQAEIGDLESRTGMSGTPQEPAQAEVKSAEAAAEAAPNQTMFGWGPQESTEKAITPAEEKQVDAAVTQANRMQNAADQGKSPEHYQGRLYHWAKQRRAELSPHLRKHFDAKMGSTANQYLTDLRTKANALQTASNDKYTKVMSQVDDLLKETPLAAPLYADLLSRKISPEEGMERLQGMTKEIIAKNQAVRQWDAIKATDAIGKYAASERFRTEIASSASLFANVTSKTLGLDNPDEIRSKISRIQTGQDKGTQQQIIQYGHNMNAYATQLEQHLYNKAKEKNAAGLDYYAMKPTDEINKEIAEAVAPYRSYAKSILGENYNMAQFTLTNMKAAASDTGRKLAESNTKLGQTIRVANAMDAGMLGNPQSMGAFIAPSLMRTPGLQGELGSLVDMDIFNAAAQLDVPPPGGKPITIQSSISGLRAAGLPVPVGAAMALEQVQQFNNPAVDARAKQSLAMYYYHTNNLKLLSEFSPEQRAKVFNTLTSKDTIDSIWEATKGRDDLRAMVSNWGRQVFGQEFLRSELKDLSTIPMPEGVKIRYDDKTSTLVLDESGIKINPTMPANPLAGDPTTAGAMGGQNPGLINLPKIRTATGKINQAISNIKHIASKSDEDPNFWIMEGLRMGGLNVDYNRVWADPKYENKVKTDGTKAP